MAVKVEPFKWDQGDPLAPEHQKIASVVRDAITQGHNPFGDIDLKRTEAGAAIAKARSEESVRIVMALVRQADHFQKIHDLVTVARRGGDCGWGEKEEEAWSYSSRSHDVILRLLRQILRRKLPLTREHLAPIASWFARDAKVPWFHFPWNGIAKTLEGLGPISADDKDFRRGLEKMKDAIPGESDELARLRSRIEAIIGPPGGRNPEDRMTPSRPIPSEPKPAGNPNVLVDLKEFLGISQGQSNTTERVVVGADRFPMRTDSPLRAEHEFINLFLADLMTNPMGADLRKMMSSAAMLQYPPEVRRRLLIALIERCANLYLEGKGISDDYWPALRFMPQKAGLLANSLAELGRDEAFDLLLFYTAVTKTWFYGLLAPVELATATIQKLKAAELSDGERYVLFRWRARLVKTAPFGKIAQEVAWINRLIEDDFVVVLVPGEALSDAINEELTRMPVVEREKWIRLLEHAWKATGSRPTEKWIKAAHERIIEVGRSDFAKAIDRWLPLVSSPRTTKLLEGEFADNSLIADDNQTCVRGLLWMTPLISAPELIRAVAETTISAYRKVKGVGARAVKVGNAGVYALSQMNDSLAVGQLALLKIKVKFGSAQKEIEKAFAVAAERSGLPREELEEMAVPTYGLTEVGESEEDFGEFRARLSVEGTDAIAVEWLNAQGKSLKGVPAKVKAEHAAELKELQGRIKDIQKMLPAQRERLDGMFLQQRSWAAEVWRERYLEHPLVGTLARRLIWLFERGDGASAGIWLDGRIIDLNGREIAVSNDTRVRLWHPIGKPMEEIVSWRRRLEECGVRQPFKQAHREIYLLTDAETRTRTYSNRFAAHVLKQHQFNALCAARGWRNQLRLMMDADYPPPTLFLPQWGLRAEFWIEGIGENYGADTAESGAFLRVATDQVRFYRMDAAQRTAHAGGGGYRPGYQGADAEPVALLDVPELVFSEVMRDVDLFVGVASVGNDPTWADGGPEGLFRNYWQSYSFGELAETAKTRRAVLERLIPKLKIVRVCRLEEKYLVVKGHLRTYRIHLGSGNILMEPNDQYLCIVPKQSAEVGEGAVMLPFEGDRTLSVILSKAFLLADDSKIKDQSIVAQIRKS